MPEKATKQDEEAKPTSRNVEIMGKKWSLPLDALNDFELMEDIYEMETRDNIAYLPKVLRRVFGDEQYVQILDTLRDSETGKVPNDAASEFWREFLAVANPN